MTPYLNQNRALVAFIAGQMHARGINAEKLAQVVGVSHTTMCRRLREPETFTLVEIRKVLSYLDTKRETDAGAFIR